ncbi:hypothetical protein JXJ21_22465 [candidate division KSB1 bacterium]|nr:hypothetical protein [candidate division KSB1 bacterium]
MAQIKERANLVADEKRISILRQRCMERKSDAFRNIALPLANALQTSAHIESWQVRRGLCTRNILSSAVFEIDDLELLVGRLAPQPESLSEIDLEKARNFLQKYPQPGGQTGHCELFLEDIMRVGIDGVSRKIHDLMRHSKNQERDTYRSFLYALDGLSTMVRNAANCACESLPNQSPERQIELNAIVDSCNRIAHHPPESFRDAIQLLWLVLFGVQYGESVGLVGPGHLDRVLYPYFQRDIESGRLTRERALLLIESLYLLLNEFIPDGLAIPVMVGGRDSQGEDVTNELSYLCLEALRRTKLIYPTVGICWHEGTPNDLVMLAIDLIVRGYPNPAFFGDDIIQTGLKNLGVPPAEACNYINSTCVEITPVGASNVWVASTYYNLCGILLEHIKTQLDEPAGTFENFKHGFRKRLFEQIENEVAGQNRCRLERQQYGRKPLQSVFTRDCIARGKDIDDGGAIYNWVECSFVGLANLADSLHTINEEIFARKNMSFAEMHAILERNFEGYEKVRRRFLNGYPKYGQGNKAVDALIAETVDAISAECKRFKMAPDDSHYVPGAFVWIMHEQLGRRTGATPDGRKAGFPFADGAGPAQGRESQGPTTAILSTTSWKHHPFIGGIAFNMKFNTSIFNSPASIARLRDLIITFLRRGGFEVQINVVDAGTLRKARKNPEQYHDLVVRIGGYTDFYTRLSTEMQEEILLRTEYDKI